MDERIGWRGLAQAIRREAPNWAQTLPALPRLVHRALAEDRTAALREALEQLRRESSRRNDLLVAWLAVLLAVLAVQMIVLL
jgi:ubiquinone biosynthesis protein